ncbi:MAG TPA: pitrilysin family protein [Pyrinomonadaceae bacterium]|jgi:zinc protease|nr:pitrilysin family protein [Pyrinomonadaceae bacterium]
MKSLGKKFAGLCLALLVPATSALTAHAQGTGATPGAQTSSPTAVAPKVVFEHYKLPNGLNVILHVDRKLPVVHVNEWFHVGSKNEKLNRTGFAHLFEHMMFQGSKNTPGEYFSYVEKAGANLFTGGVNGTTNFDRTNYFATVPSANLEFLLWLESDRVATLTDALTKEKLDNQRDVVKNERRQGLENQPYGRAFMLITENVFPKGHPYSWDVIGSHEDLTAASAEDVTDFFKTYYTPNNLSIVIAGDFDPAEARRLVEKYFGSIPPGPALDRPARWVPKLEGEKVVEVRDRVPQERVYINWPTAPFFEAGDAELDLAATILADGLSSRLNKVLVYDRQLASDVSAFQGSREIASVFTVIATARPGSSLSQIEQVITDEIARLAKSGPTPEELKRAQTKWEYRFVTGLERIGGFGGKADLLNQYNTYWGGPGRFEDDLARYRNATAESVRNVVARSLDTRNRLLVRFHPETSGRASQVALDRSKEPPIGADRRFVAPEVKAARLENGMDVFVVERRELPKVAVSLVTKAGSVGDPRGREGVAHLTATTLDTGTKTRKALEIEDALGDLGTSLQTFADRESSSVTMEVLKRNLSPALAVFSDVVRNPVFPVEEIDREKKLHLDNLTQQSNNPNALAQRVGQMLVFGPEHPYGRPRAGLPGTVGGITREDLARFHETNWKPGGSALIFAGDISLDEATTLARQAFGTWSGGAPPVVDIPAPQPVGVGKIYLIDRQDAAQTVVMQMLPGPPRKTDDFYAMNLADAVWGGGFGTRLNLNLREAKGYSYGVFSYPDLRNKAGVWVASGGVQTNKTKESVVEFVNELKSLSGAKPITEKELADAKANRVRGYAQEFESLGQLVAQIATLWSYGLPFTELQRYPDETQRLTLAAVNASAQKYAVPGKATLLLVGDRSKIEPGIRELNLGEIVILDAEGRPVSK